MQEYCDMRVDTHSAGPAPAFGKVVRNHKATPTGSFKSCWIQITVFSFQLMLLAGDMDCDWAETGVMCLVY